MIHNKNLLEKIEEKKIVTFYYDPSSEWHKSTAFVVGLCPPGYIIGFTCQ